MKDDQRQGRRIRSWIVCSVTTVIGMITLYGILNGLRPLILPFIMGCFLAYLLKPVARSFQSTHWFKYIKLGAFLAIAVVCFTWGSRTIKESWPSDKEKLVLKVRLQNRFNDRYISWMGLKDNPKGNFLYQNFGPELDPIKLNISDYFRLDESENALFLQFCDSQILEDKIPEKYYQYYVENQKAYKVDVEHLKAKASDSIQNTSENATAVHAPGLLAYLMKTASNWIIFPLVFMFVLLDTGQILQFFMRLVPNRYFELTYSIVENVDEALGKYIRGTLLECGLVGISLIVGFYICGFEFKIAFLIGLIGGMTNAIPFVGTVIACLLGAGYSLIAENVGSMLPFINDNNLMIAVVAVVMIVHLLDNAIFQPLVVGSAVSLHPLVIVMGVDDVWICWPFTCDPNYRDYL